MGGGFFAESLMPLVLAVEAAHGAARAAPAFQAELGYYRTLYRAAEKPHDPPGLVAARAINSSVLDRKSSRSGDVLAL